MPSQDHNLRALIAAAFSAEVVSRDASHVMTFGECADVALAVLSSHPVAVLSLLGTVRKGVLYDPDPTDDSWVVGPWSYAQPPNQGPVFVVSLVETAKDAS